MAGIIVDVLTEELNLKPDELERLQDLTPPWIEIFWQSTIVGSERRVQIVRLADYATSLRSQGHKLCVH